MPPLSFLPSYQGSLIHQTLAGKIVYEKLLLPLPQKKQQLSAKLKDNVNTENAFPLCSSISWQEREVVGRGGTAGEVGDALFMSKYLNCKMTGITENATFLFVLPPPPDTQHGRGNRRDLLLWTRYFNCMKTWITENATFLFALLLSQGKGNRRDLFMDRYFNCLSKTWWHSASWVFAAEAKETYCNLPPACSREAECVAGNSDALCGQTPSRPL